MWQSASVPGRQQSAPSVTPETNTVQTDWGPSLTIPTDDWPEGAYLLRMDAESGAQRFVPVTVRSASTAGKVVLKNSTSTWQAYNTWGGYDLYNGPGGVVRLRQPVAGGQPGPALRPGRRVHVPGARAGR